MLLDWILVGICGLGIAGAAWATVTSQIVGGIVPFTYFLVSKSSILKLTGTRFEARVIAKTCGNGVSEFLSNVSASIVGFLYNLQLLHYVGENGVSAYGVIMYVSLHLWRYILDILWESHRLLDSIMEQRTNQNFKIYLEKALLFLELQT